MRLLAKLEQKKVTPIGVIRFGAGLNRDNAIDEARGAGYTVQLVDGGAMLYR